MVSGQTIISRSAGVAAVGGADSSLSGFRAIVTLRLEIITSSNRGVGGILSCSDQMQQLLGSHLGECCVIDVLIESKQFHQAIRGSNAIGERLPHNRIIKSLPHLINR